MRTPNLTIIFIAISLIVVVGLAGGVALTVVDKDATAFYGFFTATLATVVAFAGLLRSQAKIEEKVDTVQHNVNGRLSQLIDIAAGKATSRADLKRVKAIAEESGVGSEHPAISEIEDTDNPRSG